MCNADRRVTVILNMGAGGGCPPKRVEQLRGKLVAAGLQPDMRQVRGEHVQVATRQAVLAGVGAVVAGGGDGTLSAVAAALCDTGTPLGVLPMGTLNHFAKDLGIPLDEDAAIATVVAGHRKTVDVGEVNGRVFINNSSLGLYPDIVRERNQLQHRLGRGKWHALFDASVNAARRYPLLNVEIELEGQILARRTPFVFVGNNEYMMEGFEIGKRHALDQGKLSLYLTQRMSRFGLLHLAARALLRRLQQSRDFHVVAARQFTVHTHHQHLRVATDGEVSMMRTPLRYGVRPGALQVLVPASGSPL